MTLRSKLGMSPIFFAVLVLSGCATAGSPSGYLNDYTKHEQGNHLRGFHAEPEFSSAVGSVRVAEIDTSYAIGTQSTFTADAASRLKSSLQAEAHKQGLGSYFNFDSSASADATLQIALTKVDPGSRAGRMWGGELGMGHAMVQVEGKVVSSAGKTLASFSELRRSSGAIGLRDIGEDAGPQLVNEMLDQLAAAIVEEFKSRSGKS